MVGEKIINTSFGEAAGHGEQAPSAWAARPLREVDPIATRRMGSPALARGRPERHLALRSKKGVALKIFSCTPYVA
jgi:hypothetical protein